MPLASSTATRSEPDIPGARPKARSRPAAAASTAAVERNESERRSRTPLARPMRRLHAPLTRSDDTLVEIMAEENLRLWRRLRELSDEISSLREMREDRMKWLSDEINVLRDMVHSLIERERIRERE